MKGTIAIEEAIIDPAGVEAHTFAQFQSLMRPGVDQESGLSAHERRLLDIHDGRLKSMDEHGVEYMLLSLTSPGCQGEPDPHKAKKMAEVANDYLAGEVKKNPKRFGALAAISMHNAQDAADELRRAVKDLGMFGGLVNDFQSKGSEGEEKVYFDTPEYDLFWKTVQDLDVPIYFHPRYAIQQDLQPGTRYGDRKHLLGAGVQFHLDLSWHLYAVLSSGFLDKYPKVQIIAGHLGEGIPFNLWRASHWINHPFKRGTRPMKQDYSYYFKNNVSITTSGNYNTRGLKYCIEEIGLDRCLYAIVDTPYETVEEAQNWWKLVELPKEQKDAVARRNAIRLFKLPLEE
ncbi:amidohydrolase-like protein 2 [Lindgomyces ingoldianus]|uniref:Amidohydrolase-like protein 2 n=1 Tax=Lindgomyces ingoldianus TaxID=673940 RepID=A0ACB6Q9G7_9PLEO|nr:amidohydrolase-like protein 2 [Lindgomyces ingoldianus]KAF2463594.1 amidohydrolase-like protein 2 [Lindgomyces ingoldianus]